MRGIFGERSTKVAATFNAAFGTSVLNRSPSGRFPIWSWF